MFEGYCACTLVLYSLFTRLATTPYSLFSTVVVNSCCHPPPIVPSLAALAFLCVRAAMIADATMFKIECDT